MAFGEFFVSLATFVHKQQRTQCIMKSKSAKQTYPGILQDLNVQISTLELKNSTIYNWPQHDLM